jgi:hypothetical protein
LLRPIQPPVHFAVVGPGGGGDLPVEFDGVAGVGEVDPTATIRLYGE